MSNAAYNRAPTSNDPREIEAWGLLQAARLLDDARRNPDDMDALHHALRTNQMLWTIFQAAVTEDNCELPRPLRADILSLSVFVDKTTFARLADLDATKIDILIDLNRNLAAGLSVQVAPDTEAEAPAAAMGGASVNLGA